MSTSTPDSLSRYRPAVITIAVVSTAYLLYLLRQQHSTAESAPPSSPVGLHRSNAIRRHGSGRRRRSTTSRRNEGTAHARITAAVTNAQQRAENDSSYGQHRMTWDRSDSDQASTETFHAPLSYRYLNNLESFRPQQCPDGVWLSFCEDYPTNLFRAFLRAEFTASITDEEAGELRRQLDTGLDAEEYLRQIDAFNSQRRLETNPRGADVAEIRNQMESGWDQTDGPGDTMSFNGFIRSAPRQETVAESDSDLSFDEGADSSGPDISQNMMDLLYHIGAEQARRAYYVHRGVQCNSCGILPIQGVRYHCINCYDYDLCEACEAGQVHTKTHVFLKIRLPGPTRGTVKHISPPLYPGKPDMMKESLPNWVSKRLLRDVKIDKTEIDAIYDQFRTLANATYEQDPLEIGMAINRAAFDQYFAAFGTSRHSPPLLMSDRIFAYYDTNNDGLIDFEEFIKGLIYIQDESRDARLRRIFRGFDLDDDGYVDRKDFLRMFRSYYAYMKEINREVVEHLEEENAGDNVRELLESSQPISAAFTSTIPHGHVSRSGIGKERVASGDLVIQDGRGVLEEDTDPHEERSNVIASAAVGAGGHLRNSHPFRSFREQPPTDEPIRVTQTTDFEVVAITHIDDATDEDLVGSDPTNQVYGWPPINEVMVEDIVTALGSEVPFEEIMDPVDRARVIRAQADRLDGHYDHDQELRSERALQERWQRRIFYTDQEEGMGRPPGYTEEDSSDGESEPRPNASATNSGHNSRRPSMRSRSSSKVRFETSLTDVDLETRSNTSSWSTPANERWGGFEISEAEREIGKELLYQTVQQSYNELLDAFFKEKEDLHLAVKHTRSERKLRADEIRKYHEELETANDTEREALLAADMIRTEELLATAVNGDARISPTVALDPETASISSHNAKIESVEDNPGVIDEFVVSDNDPSPDPTLPQFRPDHTPPAVSQPAEPSPPTPLPPLSPATLAKFLVHEEYEAETKTRGGPGKISFAEFAAKMVDDSANDDEVEKALGRRDGWTKSASLGKLQIVGMWLEWASF